LPALSARLADALPRCGLVHTDDLAWYHSVLGWGDLLVNGVLTPARAGAQVSYRPPAWEERGRSGAIELDADLHFLVIEGVGLTRRELAPEFDVCVWVETERSVRLARDLPRLAAGEISSQSYRDWMVEEDAHMARDQPWRRADLIIAGDASIPHGRANQVAVRGLLPP
jgi:hypothetical protein